VASQQSSLATLNRFYEAETAYLAAGPGSDFSGIAATLDPNCIIHQPASLPYGRQWHGHAGFENWMIAFAQQWGALEVKDSELIAHGDVIVSKSHVSAKVRVTGETLEWPLLQYVKFRDSRILELRPFHWDTAAMVSFMTK